MTLLDDIKQVQQGIALTEQQIKMKTGYDFGMKYKWHILIFAMLFSVLVYLSTGCSSVAVV